MVTVYHAKTAPKKIPLFELELCSQYVLRLLEVDISEKISEKTVRNVGISSYFFSFFLFSSITFILEILKYNKNHGYFCKSHLTFGAVPLALNLQGKTHFQKNRGKAESFFLSDER